MAKARFTRNRRRRLWLAAVAATFAVGLVAAFAGGAFADNTTPDGDNTTPVAANPLAFGTVCVNSTTNAGSLVAINRNGSATGTNTFHNGAAVTVSVLSVSGTGLSASMVNTSATITLPSNWTSLPNNTMSDAVSSQVTLVAGSSPGSFSGSVTYRASGLNADGSSIINRDATMSVSATVSNTGACSPTPPDSTPPTVTVSFPSPVSGQNGWFNAADVTPVVGTVTASDNSHVTNISCTGASLSGVTGYGTNTASGTLTVSGDGTHNVNCTATDGASPTNSGAAGGSSNTATIKIDTTAPAISDAGFGSGTAGTNGWYISTVTENFGATDATSGLADCSASFSKSSGSSEGTAVTISSGPCSDTAGNTNTGITSPSYKIDKTAPTISDLGPTSSANGNGWYNADVTNRFEASDSLSGLNATCQAAFPSGNPTHYIQSNTTSGEGTAVSVTSDGCTDLAGNHVAGISSANFQIDKTAPTIANVGAITNGSSYTAGTWANNDVMVNWDCNDSLSGPLTAHGSQTLNTESATGSVTPSCADKAGNGASGTAFSPIEIDKTAPTVLVTGVTSGAIYTLGSVPTAGCNTVDALSGVQTTATVSTTGGPIGSVTATCSGGTDNAGNTAAPQSVAYNVDYNWTGFLQPIDHMPTVNTVQAGSGVPVKFSLSGYQGLSIFATGWPKLVPLSCSTLGTLATDAIETTTAGSSSLSYDITTDQYTYVWKTQKAWAGTCGQFDVKLLDGTTHSAYFSFKK
jgi:hypothetical protein